MKTLILPCLQALEASCALVLCTILKRSGSAPRGAGACMAVFSNETALGTIGGGALEYNVKEHAKHCLCTHTSSIYAYQLKPNEVEDIGMVCGGDITVLCEYLSPQSTQAVAVLRELASLLAKRSQAWLVRLLSQDGRVLDMGIATGDKLLLASQMKQSDVQAMRGPHAVFSTEPLRLFVQPVLSASHAYVFGGGHIAQELVPLLHKLDFSPIVFDDRLEFANTALFPLAERVVLGNFSGIATKVTLTPADYVVIMTRGHHYDHELLTQVLGTPAAYIGLIGSRSKIAHTKSLLFEEGFSEQDFQRVHTPIGLPIKAETPAEIAVSIAAEMILHRASLEAASR
ncbi:MAG: XdhC family protein [Clostridia bacterium]